MTTISSMTDLDVEVHSLGVRYPVTAGPILRQTGWRGGMWAMYVTSSTDDFVVEISDGTNATGFFLFPSENYRTNRYGLADNTDYNYSSLQPGMESAGTAHNVITVCADSTRAFFKYYERIALDGGARNGAAITYGLYDKLYVSENGILCNDSPAEMAAIGITDPVEVGIVSSVPSSRNQNRLGVDIKL